MVQPILPPYVVELLPDKSNATAVIGWLFFGISAAGAIASVFAGRVIGRIGLQRVLLIAAIGVAVFLIPMGFVNSVIALSVLAIVMSLFGGFLTTSAVTLLPTVCTKACRLFRLNLDLPLVASSPQTSVTQRHSSLPAQSWSFLDYQWLQSLSALLQCTKWLRNHNHIKLKSPWTPKRHQLDDKHPLVKHAQ